MLPMLSPPRPSDGAGPAAVVLAAGAGSRLGGRPKCLLEWDTQPLICRLLDALSAAGIEEQVVVLGHHAAEVQGALLGKTATRVHNPAPRADPGSSLCCGLRALQQPISAVLIALADQPLVDADALRALIAAFAQRGDADLLVPRFAGHPGNPVIITARLAAEWRLADTLPAGRAWRDAHPERVHWFDTTNPNYCVDIDTPEDLARFRTPGGQPLRWPGQTDLAGAH